MVAEGERDEAQRSLEIIEQELARLRGEVWCIAKLPTTVVFLWYKRST